MTEISPSRRGVLALGSVLAGIALPKCPMCWALWMSAAGVARTGSGRWMYLSESGLMFLSMLCLIVAMAWFIDYARRRDRVAVCAVALAAALLTAGRFWLGSPVLIWSGLAVLIGVTVVPWLAASYRLRGQNEVSRCCK